MLKTFYLKNKHAVKPGQILTAWNSMPNQKLSEKYRVIKLVRYNKQDQIGELKVKPVNVSKDPGNLTDGHGHPSKGLR